MTRGVPALVTQLRLTTNRNREKTHCPAGHAYGGNNVALRYRSRESGVYVERRCRACRALQRRTFKAGR